MWRILLPIARAQDTFGLKAAKNVGLPETPLPKLIIQIVNTSLLLAAVIALGFIVYGGFRYIISRGDEGEIQQAKDTIVYAVIGLVVLGIAAALVNFVITAVISPPPGAPAPPPGPGR